MTIRFTPEEAENLKTMTEKNNTIGFDNPCEFIRMLLAREWNRRQGLGKVSAKQFQTAHRIGRPDWQTAQARKVNARKKLADT